MGMHVIFGSGPVGLHTAGTLLEAGERVRMVNRSGRLGAERSLVLEGAPAGGLELVGADARDRSRVTELCRDASHIYHCVNPLYHQWAEILPVVQANLIEAALGSGAVLAASENLYMYARSNRTIDLDAAVEPPTRKGRIRADLHRQLTEAGTERGLRWVTVRASDFYGPGATDQSVFGTKYFLDPLFRGRPVALMGNPDAVHSYTFVGDFGRTLALLARDERAYGRPWIIAHKEALTTRKTALRFMELAGRQIKITRLPRRLLSLIGLVNPVIREIPEMLYQKEQDYRVDSRHLEQAFGISPTPLDEGIRATLEWYARLNGTAAA